jgi:hypothetical protein
MYRSYLASISSTGLELLSIDDESVADYLRWSVPCRFGIRAVLPVTTAEMICQQVSTNQKALALATLDAGAMELATLQPRDHVGD